MLRFPTDVGFCLFQFSIKVESTLRYVRLTSKLSKYITTTLFMNISNYVYDPCQEICKIVTGVHSMLIAKSDQEIARQNDGVSRGAFVCYYATKF